MHPHAIATGHCSSPASARRPPGLLFVALSGVGLLAPFAPATAAKLAFLTSTTGYGILGDWPDAGGNTGLAAGDAICAARATAANLPEPQSFVAWLSDANNDAYCRLFGLNGKKSANCGQASLPTGAGPWQRTDGNPFMGVIDQIPSTGAVYTTMSIDEYGHDSDGHTEIFTGTYTDGTASERNCVNWNSAGPVDIGDILHTFPGWTQWTGYTFCTNTIAHIACLQKGVGAPLTPLPRAHKRAFVTSKTFTGKLGAAPEAGGNTGLAAGDAICRSLAQTANLDDASSYKAYLAAGTPPSARFENDGPWQRLDGVVFAENFAQIHAGYVRAPLNVKETGAYFQGPYGWSGILPDGGPAFQNCQAWTTENDGVSWGGKIDAVGPGWPTAYPDVVDCGNRMPLFCLSDSDLIFRSDLE